MVKGLLIKAEGKAGTPLVPDNNMIFIMLFFLLNSILAYVKSTISDLTPFSLLKATPTVVFMALVRVK